MGGEHGKLAGKTEALKEKPVPLLLYPQKLLHRLLLDYPDLSNEKLATSHLSWTQCIILYLEMG
jgi:hypothetical protein